MKMRHKGWHTEKCSRCGCKGEDREDTSCVEQQVIRTDDLDKVNDLITEDGYELFAVIPMVKGQSHMTPAGDGSSSGSGETNTTIVYILKKTGVLK